MIETGFKPIFKEEHEFFKISSGIDLPKECWRNSSKIYLDFTQPKPLLEFKVIEGRIVITKDRSSGYKDKNKIHFLPKQKSLQTLIDENKVRLEEIYSRSVQNTVKMIKENPTHFWIIGYSTGKDSTLIYKVWQDALKEIKLQGIKEPEWIINFANTSNDTADTYKEIKKLPQDKLNILNPKIGFYNWLVDIKGYFLPSTRVRNCCSTYKEGQINKAYDNDRDTIMVTGVRSKESTKRANYEMIMDYNWRKAHFDNNNVPKKWITFAPLCDEWADEDVWLFILMRDIEFNRMYRLGFHRVGCLICPFQQDYVDLLIKYYYPKAWERWIGILEKNYNVTCVEKNLKWSLNEWQNGRWKRALSKEYYLITNNPTKERVKELAKLKGISEDMAEKYFKKVCICGKKMNPTELAMFYKIQGRFEGLKDNRPVLCKKCLCKEMNINTKEYEKMATDFRDSGCTLF